MSRQNRSASVSVIIPVYNSQDWIAQTLDRLAIALKNSVFDAEIIVVNDGSTDATAKVLEAVKLPSPYKMRVISQKNKGRYLARKSGVEVAVMDNILFLDSRIDLGADSLRFLAEQVEKSPGQIWNGHVYVIKEGNPYARFWDAIAFIGWRRYFAHPRTTSYGHEDFDRYPKGTGLFFVPKAVLVEAMRWFEKTTAGIKHSSDDTLLINPNST